MSVNCLSKNETIHLLWMMANMSARGVEVLETALLMKELNGVIMMTERKRKAVLVLQHLICFPNLHMDLSFPSVVFLQQIRT